MLPAHNIPDVSKQGCKKLHPTDATQNFGLFLGGPQQNPHLSVVDYSEVVGYDGERLGYGVQTEVARKSGDLLPLLVWENFTTEEKWIEQAKERGESTEFPGSPGVFALSPPYEKAVLVISENCPARYVNDAKGVSGSKQNIQFVQHTDPKEIYYDPMKGIPFATSSGDQRYCGF